MNQLSMSKAGHALRSKGIEGWELHDRAASMKEDGDDIVLLTIGDPDFNTSAEVNNALITALGKHRTHYSNPQGEYELRSTLAALETANVGKTFTPNQFNIFNGAANALYTVLRCIVPDGKNIVLNEPYYIGYQPTLVACGITTKYAPAVAPEFKISAQAIADTIDENTVAVLLNTPVNPTGNVVSADVMRELYEGCRERNIWLISDEVYSLITFEQPHTSLLSVADDLSNVIVMDSLSKSHAMTGWRIGWTVTNESLASILSKYALASTFTLTQFTQDAAITALRGCKGFVENMNSEFKLRRDYTMSRIQKIKGLDAITPDAGMFVMVDVHQDGDEFANRMLDEIGVSVAPGSACGAVTSNYVRVSYVSSLAELEKAWDRIESWLASNTRSKVPSSLVINAESLKNAHLG